jgi:hypothetical protein
MGYLVQLGSIPEHRTHRNVAAGEQNPHTDKLARAAVCTAYG